MLFFRADNNFPTWTEVLCGKKNVPGFDCMNIVERVENPQKYVNFMIIDDEYIQKPANW